MAALVPTSEPLRVFLSSTFIDMQREREELAKRAFLPLRQKYAEQGYLLIETDLRWGITEAEANSGKVLPICFDEVRRASIFMGILGQRYGTPLSQIMPVLHESIVETEPWVVPYHDRSITELEIRLGVLNAPRLAKHVFFYLRRADWCKTLTAEQASNYVSEGAARLSLEQLLDELRGAGFSLQIYDDPRDLPDLVNRDLENLLKTIPRRDEVRSDVNAELESQRAFVARCRYGRSRRSEIVDQFARMTNSGRSPVLVQGVEGSGKTSALVDVSLDMKAVLARTRANSLFQRWMSKIHAIVRRTDPNELLVVAHFLDATPDSANLRVMLKCLVHTLTQGALEAEIPDDLEVLHWMFAQALEQAAKRSRVLLVLDGLDRLQGPARELQWLPHPLPDSVMLVASTRSGTNQLEGLAEHPMHTWDMPNLSVEERQAAIATYLDVYRRRLDTSRLERLATADPLGSPVFLRTIIEELRVSADFAKLDDFIKRYVTADDLPELLRRILQRIENDVEQGRPGLVRDALTLLWAARRGLTEDELMDLLGEHGARLPSARWVPLRFALGGLLEDVHGYLRIAYDTLRSIVETLYLPRAGGERTVRMRLADYFAADVPNARAFEECPWQLEKARAWEQLRQWLESPHWLVAGDLVEMPSLRRYWAVLQSNTGRGIETAYRDLVALPQHAPDASRIAAKLLAQFGCLEDARHIFEELEKHEMAQGNAIAARGMAMERATLLRRMERVDDALALLTNLADAAHNQGDSHELATTLGNLALAHFERGAPGDIERALDLHREEEQILARGTNHRALAICRFNRARVLSSLGKWKEARKVFDEYALFCRRSFDPSGLMAALGNLAVANRHLGEASRAKELHKEEWRLARLLGNIEAQCANLRERSFLLQEDLDFDGAKRLLDEHDALVRAHPNFIAEAMGLAARACLYLNLGHAKRAADLAGRARSLVQGRAAGPAMRWIEVVLTDAEARRTTARGN